MTAPNLNPNEVKVLALLATGDSDFGFMSFRTITRWTRLPRQIVRRSCRSLTRKGLAQYSNGLWSEDGEPGGAGYAVTSEGRTAADPKLVDRYALRRYDR